MSDNSINDFLLDQELEGDDVPESELPDDIDAILDAVEEEEEVISIDSDQSYADDTLADIESQLLTPDEINIAEEPTNELPDDGIPIVTDIIDPPPNRKK